MAFGSTHNVNNYTLYYSVCKMHVWYPPKHLAFGRKFRVKHSEETFSQLKTNNNNKKIKMDDHFQPTV